MKIRPFVVADAENCAKVFHRAVHEGAAEHYSEEVRNAWSPEVPSTAVFASRLGAHHCFVADDGDIQGFMSLTDDGYWDMAFVAPEFRRTGLASELYAVVLGVAREQEMQRLTTHASLMAQPFFSRQGWQIEGPETVVRSGVKVRRFKMFIDLTN